MGGSVVSLVRRVRSATREQDRHEVIGICLARVHIANKNIIERDWHDVEASHTRSANSQVDVDAHMPLETPRGG